MPTCGVARGSVRRIPRSDDTPTRTPDHRRHESSLQPISTSPDPSVPVPRRGLACRPGPEPWGHTDYRCWRLAARRDPRDRPPRPAVPASRLRTHRRLPRSPGTGVPGIVPDKCAVSARWAEPAIRGNEPAFFIQQGAVMRDSPPPQATEQRADALGQPRRRGSVQKLHAQDPAHVYPPRIPRA